MQGQELSRTIWRVVQKRSPNATSHILIWFADQINVFSLNQLVLPLCYLIKRRPLFSTLQPTKVFPGSA